jgi:class 3 adenylate cyclase/predicted ATPase
MTDVAAWLKELGLERYEPAFRESEISTAVLPELTEADLKELGLPLGPRKLLLRAIAALATPAQARATEPSTPSAVPREAERRQLTVMFVDLVGSTELAAKLDPEDMREVLRAYQDASAGMIARFEGFVAKFMGDGVLAYFGYPRAHEDEAERAVRAGLALATTVSGLKAPKGEALGARIGIATGLVVVGDLVGKGAAQEQAVVGETPNLAARLQALAAPGQVVIAEATRRLLGAGFDLQDLGERELKGLGTPVQAYSVTGERPVESRFEAMSGPALLPMVGRDQELALLLERWARAKAGEGQGVLLVGEAGIGKSRISRALLDAVAEEPHFRIRYQCSPYHTDSALWPVIQQLSRAAGLGAEDTLDLKLDKLEALLERAGSHAGAPLIADLLGIDGSARYGLLDLTPQAKRARTLEALGQQMLGLAARQPVLVVIEDAHWIDPTTLEVIEQGLDRSAAARVLMVLTSRPDRQPALAAHPHVTRLTLNRLARAGVEAIVARVGGEGLPGETIDAIIARTDGVPLFVEELTKAVLETGETAIPASLHDSLMARLDRIPEVKEVAQIAATIGREFDYTLLVAIVDRSEPDLRSALDKLAAAELIFRRGTAPEIRYTFKHALVRDTAYQSLLKSRRQQVHARIAEALEEQFPNTARIEPEVLARHYTGAGLTEQAIAHWQRAAEHAARRSANLEAIAHLTKGLKLLRDLPRDLDHQRLELDMQIALGGTLVTTKGWAAPETAAAFGRARELCELSGDSSHLIAVDWGEMAADLLRGELDRALQKAEATLRRAEGGNDVTALLMAHRGVGVTSIHLGHMKKARAHLERALALYDPEAHAPLAHRFGYDARVAVQAYLSSALLHLGHPDQALATGRRAVEDARRLAHANSLCFALVQFVIVHQAHDDVPANAGMLEELIALCSEQGFSIYLPFGLVYRGLVSILSGRTEAGLSEMQQGLSGWQRPGVKAGVPLLFIQRAKADLLLGRPKAGVDRLAEALAMIEDTGERWFQSEAYRLKGKLLLSLREPHAIEAEAAFARAIDVARSQDGKWPELRAARDLARLWAEEGERQKAYDLLAPVYAWFTEGFDTADVKDAKALLDELS